MQQNVSGILRLLKVAPLWVWSAFGICGIGPIMCIPGVPEPHGVGGSIAGHKLPIRDAVVIPPEVCIVISRVRVGFGRQGEIHIITDLTGGVGKYILVDNVIAVVGIGEGVTPTLNVDAHPT